MFFDDFSAPFSMFVLDSLVCVSHLVSLAIALISTAFLLMPRPGGKQYKVTEEDVIVVNKIAADIGDKIKLEKVLYN